MNMNKVLVAGNLTRDIETRQAGQSTVASIGLAINRRYRAGSEWKEEVAYIDCEAWGKTAETMAAHLSKGRSVFIEGRLKLDTWQDKKDGSNRSKLKVVVENFQFVGGQESRGESMRAPVDEADIPF